MRHTRRLQGLGSHVHVNKAIGFFFILMLQSYHFLTAGESHCCDLCGQTLTKEFPFAHHSVAWNLIMAQREFFFSPG